jgi:hypothetical protein
VKRPNVAFRQAVKTKEQVVVTDARQRFAKLRRQRRQIFLAVKNGSTAESFPSTPKRRAAASASSIQVRYDVSAYCGFCGKSKRRSHSRWRSRARAVLGSP